MTTAPARGIIVCIYLSVTPCLLHPGSRGQCTPWNAPCIPVCWHAHMCDLQLHSTEQQGWLELLVSAMKIRWMRRHNYYSINGFSLLRQWTCSCQATCQCACQPVWITNDRWAYCTAVLWCSYRPRRDTELTTVPTCYLWCRIVQTNSAETSLALLHM